MLRRAILLITLAEEDNSHECAVAMNLCYFGRFQCRWRLMASMNDLLGSPLLFSITTPGALAHNFPCGPFFFQACYEPGNIAGGHAICREHGYLATSDQIFWSLPLTQPFRLSCPGCGLPFRRGQA
jgi:hypothetical protein